MSDRRWWIIPKVFAFPLWSNNTIDDVKKSENRVSNEKTTDLCNSDDEDLEEFLEKQRNARLGYTDVQVPSSEKSNRKYSTDDDRADEKKLTRSKSKKQNSRSSSKSSCSTKYSSFSKSSDVEIEKTIKETIYELTGAGPQICFSFFNDAGNLVFSENKECLYDNVENTETVEGKYFEKANTEISLTNSLENARTTNEAEDIIDNVNEVEDVNADNEQLKTDFGDSSNSKERHVTKLTILLTPVICTKMNEETIVEKNAPTNSVAYKEEMKENIEEELLEVNEEKQKSEIEEELFEENEEKQKSEIEEELFEENEEKQNSEIDEDESEENFEENTNDDFETEIDENPLYSVIDKQSNRRSSTAENEKLETAESVDYVELSEFQQFPSGEAVTQNMEYCNHRVKVKTRLRKISLRRKRASQTSLKKMNLRFNKAWRSIRGWWQEEKTKLVQLRPKNFIKNDRPNSVSPDSSDRSFYESVKHLNKMQENDYSSGQLDEDGYCNLEPRYTNSLKSKENTEERRKRRKSCISELNSFHPPYPPPPRTSGVNAFRRSRYYPPQGQDGFEDLRRYIKQGGDFCKELSVILQERSEAEIQYAKTLSKLSSKLLKVSKEAVGTVSQAWHKAGIELETTSEIHKTFATALCEEVVKPLKQLLESQHRIRKSVENAVDKTGKNLSEWRAAESKSKKQSFVNARENEKLQDVTLDVRLSSSLTGSNKLTASSLHLHQKQGSEKECSKLETKRKKSEELVKKSNVEYYTYCIRAERARLEWETAVVRGNQCFQALEEERLQQLKHLAFVYWQHCRDVGPKLTQSSLKLKEPIESCDVDADIKTIASIKGVEQPVSEQLLPDFYAEHTTLAMNRERRRQALVKVLQLIVQDLERERRGKNGVENLARAFKQSPNFSNDDSQQNVSEKLHHMRFMLTYLEAARFKISCALAELDGKVKPSHPLAPHIHMIRDRQGFQQSILKVPPWVHKDIPEQSEQVESPDWTDRGTADGNSVQPDSDFDEFSSQSSSEKDFESNVFAVLPDSAIGTSTPSSGGRCRALYHYTANLYDELNLQPGDVINIHDKQPDGWWLGELNGVVGIFPATYVEEIS